MTSDERVTHQHHLMVTQRNNIPSVLMGGASPDEYTYVFLKCLKEIFSMFYLIFINIYIVINI